jgi:hypothetical protein
LKNKWRNEMLKTVLLIVLLAADITGTWKVVLEGTTVPSTPTLVLTQKGQEITGTYSGRGGDGQVRGTIEGNKIDLFIESPGQPPRTLSLNGFVDSDGTKMEGTYRAPGRGSRNGFFTATRSEAK